MGLIGRMLCWLGWHHYDVTLHGRIIGPCRRCGHVWTWKETQ